MKTLDDAQPAGVIDPKKATQILQDLITKKRTRSYTLQDEHIRRLVLSQQLTRIVSLTRCNQVQGPTFQESCRCQSLE